MPLTPIEVTPDSVISIVISDDTPTARMGYSIWRVDPASAEPRDDEVLFDRDSREAVASEEVVPASVVSYVVEVGEGTYAFVVDGIWSDGKQGTWGFHVRVVGESP